MIASPSRFLRSGLLPTLAALLSAVPVFAGERVACPPTDGASAAPSDLTLGNFFSEGWNQAWVHRADPDAAPDMALLKVQTNFLEREFRFDFYSERNVNSPSKNNIDYLDALVAYSFNRRFMLEIVGDYEWDQYRLGTGNDRNGGAAAAVARLQLIDLPGASYALTFRVNSPNHSIDNQQTVMSAALAGWHDLSRIGLPRTGLYFHVQEETYAGPGNPGAKRTDLTYDITLAKTWTRPNLPVIGNFTTFVEAYGVTNLDGDDQGSTSITITPGFRTTLGHGHILMAGADIPVTRPQPYGVVYRLTYIINF